MTGATLRDGESVTRSSEKISNGTVVTESRYDKDGGFSCEKTFIPGGGVTVPPTRSGGADAKPGALRAAIQKALKD